MACSFAFSVVASKKAFSLLKCKIESIKRAAENRLRKKPFKTILELTKLELTAKSFVIKCKTNCIFIGFSCANQLYSIDNRRHSQDDFLQHVSNFKIFKIQIKTDHLANLKKLMIIFHIAFGFCSAVKTYGTKNCLRETHGKWY